MVEGIHVSPPEERSQPGPGPEELIEEIPADAFCEAPVQDELYGAEGEKEEAPPPPPPPPEIVSGEKILSLVEGAVELSLGVPCRLRDDVRRYVGELLDAIGPPPLLPARRPSPKSRWKWLIGVVGAYAGLAIFQGIQVKKSLARLQAAQAARQTGDNQTLQGGDDGTDHSAGGGEPAP